MEQQQISFPQIVERGCGLDVHKETVVATIAGNDIVEETQTFSTFTSSLETLHRWLKEKNITHVAMESTSVYWKPIFNILEDHFEIVLVNAQHIKNVPGHKTDKKDSAWIAKLLLSGLLKGSFIPPRPIRELRDLFRYKRKLIGQRVGERNRLQKILEDANIKLSSVVSDTFGVSAQRMIAAIIAGETNPTALAQFARGSLIKKRQELEEALTGKITEHHRFMLNTILQSITHIDEIIATVDTQIDHSLSEYAVDYQLLQTIPGVARETAIAILAEVGNDMTVFPDQHHLASWAGMSPGNNESAGKKKSARITHGNSYLKTALVEAAWVASHQKQTYLRAKYDSLVGRRGKKRALIAVGHKILCAVYFILLTKAAYDETGYDHLMERKKQQQVKRYLSKLHQLGVHLEVKPESEHKGRSLIGSST